MLVTLHAFSQFVSEVVNVNFSGSGMIDDSNEYVVQVFELLLSALQLGQVLSMASIGELQLVILRLGLPEIVLQLLDLPLSKVKLLLCLLNVSNHV